MSNTFTLKPLFLVTQGALVVEKDHVVVESNDGISSVHKSVLEALGADLSSIHQVAGYHRKTEEVSATHRPAAKGIVQRGPRKGMPKKIAYPTKRAPRRKVDKTLPPLSKRRKRDPETERNTTPAERAQISALYQKGYSLRDIGDHFGITRNAAERWAATPRDHSDLITTRSGGARQKAVRAIQEYVRKEFTTASAYEPITRLTAEKEWARLARFKQHGGKVIAPRGLVKQGIYYGLRLPLITFDAGGGEQRAARLDIFESQGRGSVAATGSGGMFTVVASEIGFQLADMLSRKHPGVSQQIWMLDTGYFTNSFMGAVTAFGVMAHLVGMTGVAKAEIMWRCLRRSIYRAHNWEAGPETRMRGWNEQMQWSPDLLNTLLGIAICAYRDDSDGVGKVTPTSFVDQRKGILAWYPTGDTDLIRSRFYSLELHGLITPALDHHHEVDLRLPMRPTEYGNMTIEWAVRNNRDGGLNAQAFDQYLELAEERLVDSDIEIAKETLLNLSPYYHDQLFMTPSRQSTAKKSLAPYPKQTEGRRGINL